MKRDMELIRRILQHIEDHDSVRAMFDDPSVDQGVLEYHLALLVDGKMIDGVEIFRRKGRKGIGVRLDASAWMTSKGHDFLDNSNVAGVWDSVSSRVRDVGNHVGMSVMVAMLKDSAMRALKLISHAQASALGHLQACPM